MNRSRFLRFKWVAILALLWHALMPLAHAMQGQTGLLMTLCSVDGSRQVFVPLDGGEPRPMADAGVFQCPLCSVGAHWTFDSAPARLDALIDPALTHVQAAPRVYARASATRWWFFSPRAPPAHA